jgi:hypothetical protein
MDENENFAERDEKEELRSRRISMTHIAVRPTLSDAEDRRSPLGYLESQHYDTRRGNTKALQV